MDNEWDTVTRIGQSRSGGGGGPRPKTLKTKAELNAAMRIGGVQTERKVGSANSVSISLFFLFCACITLCTYTREQKPNLEGQRDKKVDDETGITKLEAPGKRVSKAVEEARVKLGWSQSDLAKKCSTTTTIISKLEKGEKQDKTAKIPWDRLQNNLGVMLTGSNIGQPTPAAKRKEKAAAEAAAAEKGKAKE